VSRPVGFGRIGNVTVAQPIAAAAKDTESALVEPVLGWFRSESRTLPWRSPDAGPWAVLVSEFMLQQTPVARVLPVYLEWLARWPTPAALAAEPAGAAVRAWGRLGYPRRALRLHGAAVEIVASHGGELPAGLAELRSLPGVGDYTAAAVASFAFRQRHAVLDTNVRRVIARAVSGLPAASPSVTVAERRLAESLLPADADRAASFGVAMMELGALVCQARTPACGRCPIEDLCAWTRAGRPAETGPSRRGQSYAGTDRQARGRLLAVLRGSAGPVSAAQLSRAWPDGVQRERARAALVADGLVVALPGNRFSLPGE
jgi:A/G-specific adenine glycosylase